MSDPLASIRALIEQQPREIREWLSDHCGIVPDYLRSLEAAVVAVLASVPPPQEHPEESLATRILFEQKDLEAHTLNVTDVDRLTQIRDSVLKEPQP
jgi:hypothetical protein